MKKFAYLLLIGTVIFSCKNAKKQEEIGVAESKLSYKETYRPQFHFSPPEKWMNDPNGLVYNDGVYHLFYQYYPDATVWGPMHWGHATSKDMVTWENKPIALYPDRHGLIFSGSAVVDNNNTSGFGKEGETPLVAIYTYHLMEGEKAGRKDFQTQGIAYSLDNGESWIKYNGNPVIENNGIKDFRDPKVSWHHETQSWVMALVAGDHAKFYRSKNLKEWNYISDFGKNQGAHGGVWECPDLFKLKVEGTDEEKWVLIISIGSGGPNGGSGTQYFVGDFDGTTFTSEQTEFKWLDWGTDNYAGVTYNNSLNDDRIFVGWMSNWQYALSTPTTTWRSAMTVPRRLSLKKHNESYTLQNYPLESLSTLMQKTNKETLNIASNEEKKLIYDNLNETKITFKTDSKDFKIKLGNKAGESVSIKFDSASELVIIDRTKSGKTDFQPEFGNKLHYMPINNLPASQFEVQILMDRSSMELFINGGQYVMTEQLFPNENYTDLYIKNTNAMAGLSLKDLSIAKMSSIWD
ncbi:glycoside hydrolase family 32 protein [Croceitalea marina]|uniref:Glycoside hydrolase family 32 protein n=1 Tax=Croceitalea marina TaxID=1775166 RepID=A0ABW5MVG1_9FLAO